MRKEEHSLRDTAVDLTRKAIAMYEEKIEKLVQKKPWITGEHKKDVLERMIETLAWLEENIEK